MNCNLFRLDFLPFEISIVAMPSASYPEILAAEARAQARRRGLWRVLMVFLLGFFAMQYAWEMARGSAIERVIIDEFTVRPAAWLIDGLWPTDAVRAEGHRLVTASGRLNVLNGCEGLETLFMLVAALIAYPFPWRVRLVGLLAGTALVFALNQARIVLLWHAFMRARDWFGVLHGTLLPLLLVAVCLVFFLLLLSREAPQTE